jgi:hypothetical protein
LPSRQPTGVRGQPGGSEAASPAEASESAARAAPRGRLDGEKIVRIRRQVKKIGPIFVFALPKNDRERIIPLSDWDVEVIRRHIIAYPPLLHAAVGEAWRQAAYLQAAVPLAL